VRSSASLCDGAPHADDCPVRKRCRGHREKGGNHDILTGAFSRASLLVVRLAQLSSHCQSQLVLLIASDELPPCTVGDCSILNLSLLPHCSMWTVACDVRFCDTGLTGEDGCPGVHS